MIAFIVNQLGTIIVGLIILFLLMLIVIKIVRDNKNGKCAGCHTNQKECPKNCKQSNIV
ncbi:MAG: FeoB-associated Cys-rich membrane protein [Lachnoclostridium sp.]|jgi:hypothetical protein|nr:FeoB-associated Cys-rich membrane protein [Lachnoclostridium sp.]